jgi:hypothetical protein
MRNLWNRVHVGFAALSATVGVSQSVGTKPPVVQSGKVQHDLDKQILEKISTAVEATDTTLKVASSLQPSRELVPLALRDGTGVVRSVVIERHRMPAILEFARQCGRTPTITSAVTIAGRSVQMLELAIKFSDPDVATGVSVIATDVIRGLRGQETTGLMSRGRRRVLEDAFNTTE